MLALKLPQQKRTVQCILCLQALAAEVNDINSPQGVFPVPVPTAVAPGPLPARQPALALPTGLVRTSKEAFAPFTVAGTHHGQTPALIYLKPMHRGCFQEFCCTGVMRGCRGCEKRVSARPLLHCQNGDMTQKTRLYTHSGRLLLPAGFLCALMYGALLYALCALSAEHLLLLVLPCAVLAAAAYFGLMNAAVLHAVLPHTAPLARAEPGTVTGLARQIVRCPLLDILLSYAKAIIAQLQCNTLSLEMPGPHVSFLSYALIAGGSLIYISQTSWHIPETLEAAQCIAEHTHAPPCWQVAVHAEIQLQARRLCEGLMESIVQKPIYLVDFATFEVPAE